MTGDPGTVEAVVHGTSVSGKQVVAFLASVV
jgi:hypothetical protein